MIYFDTNVLIAVIDEEDPNHKLVRKLPKSGRVTSKLALAELVSVFSRAGIDDPLSLSFYSLKLAKAELLDVDFDEVFNMAFKLAPELRLRTLDLLHIAICKVIGVDRMATFDKEIIRRRKTLEGLGVEVSSLTKG